MLPDYSFQDDAIENIHAARQRGVPRLLTTSPTGSGKGTIIVRLFEDELAAGGRPIVYTNRRIIREQLHERLNRYGVSHGVRAAGVMPNHHRDAQVSSIDTERARSLTADHPWRVFDATLAIIDEAHSNKAPTAQKLLDEHENHGAFVVGMTATPVGLGFQYGENKWRLYDELLVMATQRQMRDAGVLVPCEVFAPSEIDCSDIDVNSDGEYVQTQCQERFEKVKHVVFGSVVEWLRKLNPALSGTVLFPPGVPESRWFVEQLNASGISAFHIDADTPDDDRTVAFRDHQKGTLKVISSYGVMAEGWDAPWASHCILCRPVAAVTTYLQLVGRVLRAYQGKHTAILQDHVGAWYKPGLGSPNADRHWELETTNRSIAAAVTRCRQFPEFDEDGKEQEAARCPKCARPLRYRSGGYKCVCGHEFKRSQRMVIERDGTLVRKVGMHIKRKPKRDDTYFVRKAVFQAVQSGRTVGQTYALACILKAKHLETGHAWISRSDSQIYIPSKEHQDWHMLASDYYSWAVRQLNARRNTETVKPF